ncbi:MAG: ribonuclease III, partial [Leptospiraceae bacterium]|nr:ribonuclease III [Leptospiraceae bacterium]
TYPKLKEGELAKKKSILVSEPVLASIAKELELGNYLLLGKGELASQGKERISNLADLLEALLGAMYLDAGLEKTKKWFLPYLKSRLKKIQEYQTVKDAKTLLQELTQKRYKKVPIYKVLEEKGLDHKKEFLVEVKIESFSAQGIGQNKKEAETNAARKLLEILQEN